MSNNHIKVNLHVAPENVLLAKRKLGKGGAAQKFVDSEVLRCSDKYVPMDTSMLKKSGTTSTVVGSGMVHWDTPYAKPNYYKNRGRGKQGTAKGGLRGKLWFERMKQDHLPGILRGVKRISGAK
ncbi:minor capsid protein [Ruminococcus flavefaciens]|uniref:minor capsid protein n=1 Tax=Ruminococcus flavefaciens TaxID=1265 RepID=UPI0026EF697B|nr:minor capsid protein [Ruminococcus flavefaciens]